jgi:hypothetical protein
MNELAIHDAWQYTLDLLESVSSTDYKLRGVVPNQRSGSGIRGVQMDARLGAPPVTAHVKFIEHLSEELVTLCCHDATTGRYGEQSWKLAKARGGGVCALSGATIRRGDAVYRPWARGRSPSNAGWMVLASAIPTDQRQGLALAD